MENLVGLDILARSESGYAVKLDSVRMTHLDIYRPSPVSMMLGIKPGLGLPVRLRPGDNG